MLDPLRQVTGRDRTRSLLDVGQRFEADAHEPEARRRHRSQYGEADQEFDREQTTQRAVDIAERDPDHKVPT